MTDILRDVATTLEDELNIHLSDTLSEEAILQLLANHILNIIERGSEVFSNSCTG